MLLLGMLMCLQHDRELTFRILDVRVDAINDRTIRGVAVPFEKWQRIPDSADMRARKRPRKSGRINPPGASRFREKVRRGAIKLPTGDQVFGDAFEQALREQGIHDIKGLVNHNTDNVLSRLSDGGLKLSQKNDNLNFEMIIPDTSLGNKVLDDMSKQADRSLKMSIGFKRKGRRSNIVRKNYDKIDDATAEKEFLFPEEQRAVTNVGLLDERVPELQDGLLDGSDYFEGINPPTGRRWTVYFQLDIREISILTPDVKPAWEGTFAEMGAGLPTNKARFREIDMLGMGINV